MRSKNKRWIQLWCVVSNSFSKDVPEELDVAACSQCAQEHCQSHQLLATVAARCRDRSSGSRKKVQKSVFSGDGQRLGVMSNTIRCGKRRLWTPRRVLASGAFESWQSKTCGYAVQKTVVNTPTLLSRCLCMSALGVRTAVSM